VANTAHVSFFLPTQLRAAIESSARENDRSLSAEVRCALRANISALACPAASFQRIRGRGEGGSS